MPGRLRDVDLELVDSLVVPASSTAAGSCEGCARSTCLCAPATRSSASSFSRSMCASFPSEPAGLASEPRLTPRPREILDLMASGLSTSLIAKKLTISTETVRNHVRSMLRELQVHTRLEAIAAARRLGLLAPPALGTASARELMVSDGSRGRR